jgi:hypothetical protein
MNSIVYISKKKKVFVKSDNFTQVFSRIEEQGSGLMSSSLGTSEITTAPP